MSEMTIAEIFDAFESASSYPRTAVDAALAQRTEIVPELVRVLDATLAEPSAHLTDRSPVYALLLLGHLKATEAHPVLVDLVSLPKDWPYRLFGDLITEEFTMLLYNTSGNQFDHIYDLVRNDQVDPFARSAAADVLVYGVADGVLDRQAVLAFFGSLFATEQSAETESDFLTLLVRRINDLYPAEILPILRQAFESDIIDPTFIDLEHVEKTLASNTVESALATVRTEMTKRSLDDVHTLLAEWLDFGEAELDLVRLDAAVRKAAMAAKNANTAKQKNKRKMAKASRKKNRRK